MINIKINKNKIGISHPTYFIADIGANHDGNLNRAKKLIELCAKAGANAAKFQHFKAETIVSDYGFKNLKIKTHQSKWKHDVFSVYKKASINPKWTKELIKTCKKFKIDFFTSPYDLDYIDDLNKYLCAYKIGSGDITWLEIIKKISKRNKPVMIATGASDLNDVERAYKLINKFNKKLVIMQCNTNYTGSRDNFKHIELNVLRRYKELFPGCVLGLSDHTLGHTTVLGAVALGARVIEKHFTDDVSRDGADHGFSMTSQTWSEMVERTRDLEAALGTGKKQVMPNELSTVVLQRRSLHASRYLEKGMRISEDDCIALRPCPVGSFKPFELDEILGSKLKRSIAQGECITINDICDV